MDSTVHMAVGQCTWLLKLCSAWSSLLQSASKRGLVSSEDCFDEA
jgi:hypothetical protein